MRKSRILATALAVTLTMGLMPTAAFAAAPASGAALTTATVRGATVDSGTGDTAIGDAIDTASLHGSVTLTEAQAEDTTGTSFVSTGNTVKAVYYADATALADAETDFATDDAFVDATDGTIANGSYFVVSVDGTDDAFYVIDVTVSSNSGSLGGAGTVDSTPLIVVVPMKVDFKVNPLELGSVTPGNQMTSASYPVVNKALAPVKVTFDLTVEATKANTAIEFVADKAEVDVDSMNVTESKMFFGYLGATGEDTGSTISFDDGTGGKFTYDAEQDENNATLAGFSPVESGDGEGPKASGQIAFALAAAKDTDATPDGVADTFTPNTGVAAFQFFTNLNTYAQDWTSETFTVTGTYTILGLRPGTYGEYAGTTASDPDGNPGTGDETLAVPGSFVEGGMNQLISGPALPAGVNVSVAAGATASHTVDRTGGKTGYKIFLSDIPADVTKVGQIVDGAEYDIMALGFATYDDATGVVSVTKLPSGTAAKIVITSDTAKTYTVNLTIE